MCIVVLAHEWLANFRKSLGALLCMNLSIYNHDDDRAKSVCDSRCAMGRTNRNSVLARRRCVNAIAIAVCECVCGELQ